MSESKPFKLGTKPRWGATTCGFGVDRNDCSQPATTHVMWLDTAATSSTCDEHLGYIRDNADLPYETHTFGGDCGMPGSLWHHPYEDEDEGYCIFPAVDDLAHVVAEPERVTA